MSSSRRSRRCGRERLPKAEAVTSPVGLSAASECAVAAREQLGSVDVMVSNAGIAHRLWVTEGTVEKHVRSILAKLPLPETGEDHRRVLAVLTFLEAR